MADIFDYLNWRGDLTVQASPFNPVDGMILARLSYLPFDGIVGHDNGKVLSIAEASRAVLNIPDIQNRVLIKNDTRFASELEKSDRFRNMKILSYVNHLDSKTQTQFSAVTVLVDDNTLFISFRGTDNTLIGWKEDFNMTFEFPVPAQLMAAEYVSMIANHSSDCRLLIGGHSKGGNLAVYSAAFCGDEIQKRIESVYNYDGPGFNDEALASEGYRRVCGRVNTYVPQSSVVGMMLGHEEKYTIVHSEESGMMQHDIYSWNVLPTGFYDLQTVNNSSRFVDYTLKAWVSSLDPSQREQFFDTVYGVLRETNASTLHEMSEKWFSTAMSVLKSFKNLDEPTRKSVTKGIALLFKCAKFGYSQLRQTRQQESAT